MPIALLFMLREVNIPVYDGVGRMFFRFVFHNKCSTINVEDNTPFEKVSIGYAFIAYSDSQSVQLQYELMSALWVILRRRLHG